MTKPRIAIAGFQHETNTFAPMPTRLVDFETPGAWPGLTKGENVISVFSDLNIPIGGFITAGTDFELVPILWANSEPSGYVQQSAYDAITKMICDGLKAAGPLDGIYFDLHGAMTTEDFEDGQGELLNRVRAEMGDDIPIAVSLDLHGNLTQNFADKASVVAIYRTYPHVDMAETGARTAQLLQERLEYGRPFAYRFRQLDYLIPLQAQSTMREPGRRIYAQLPGLEADGVSVIDFAFGFPPADIDHCGASVLAYGTDQRAVDTAVNSMIESLNAAEAELAIPLVPEEEAVARAIALSATSSKPVVLADAQDNPGAGAVGDSTGIAKTLIKQGARNAMLGMLWDPDAAAKAHDAGEGAEMDLTIGGLYPELDYTPLNVRVRVEKISDGAFTFTGPMYGGAHARLGKMARLLVLDDNSGVRIVIGSARCQNADQAIFTHMDLDPTKGDIVVVKSAVHFLADYDPIAEEVIFTESPGANPCQLDTIPFTRLREGVRLGPGGPAFRR
ncbi:MAG: M81 family metallopeptidase [Hyphomicrobiales bacterium]